MARAVQRQQSVSSEHHCKRGSRRQTAAVRQTGGLPATVRSNSVAISRMQAAGYLCEHTDTGAIHRPSEAPSATSERPGTESKLKHCCELSAANQHSNGFAAREASDVDRVRRGVLVYDVSRVLCAQGTVPLHHVRRHPDGISCLYWIPAFLKACQLSDAAGGVRLSKFDGRSQML